MHTLGTPFRLCSICNVGIAAEDPDEEGHRCRRVCVTQARLCFLPETKMRSLNDSIHSDAVRWDRQRPEGVFSARLPWKSQLRDRNNRRRFKGDSPFRKLDGILIPADWLQIVDSTPQCFALGRCLV
jgi:hypothetical protein